MNEILILIGNIFFEAPLAQSIGIIATIILTASGVIENDKKMLYILTMSFGFWSLHFYLLGFNTAAFLYFFMLIRNFLFFQYPKNKTLFILSAIIPIGSLIFTYNGYLDILATIAPLVFTYSVYMLKGLQLRIGMIIISCIWLYYSIVATSIGGVITEIIYLIGILIGVLRIYRRKK